jgi:hypothetical protein
MSSTVPIATTSTLMVSRMRTTSGVVPMLPRPTGGWLDADESWM